MHLPRIRSALTVIDLLLTRLVYVGGVVDLGFALAARALIPVVSNVAYRGSLTGWPRIIALFDCILRWTLICVLITVKVISNYSFV